MEYNFNLVKTSRFQLRLDILIDDGTSGAGIWKGVPARITRYVRAAEIKGKKIENAYRSVGHPAAGFNLIGIQSPEFQFLFKERSANVGRVVQFPRSACK